MLQSQKNKQTLSILARLRQKGPDNSQTGTVPLMGMDDAEQGEQDIDNQEDDPNGQVIRDNSIPGILPKKKKLLAPPSV